MSGLNQHIANVPYAKVYRGFESLSLRHHLILYLPIRSNKTLPDQIQTGKDFLVSYPDIKHTLVAMSERTGMSVSQVTDEVLYTGLVEMQRLEEL